MSITRTAGWYPDPINVGSARFWDGTAWTPHVSYGGQALVSMVPLDEVDAAAAAHDATVVRRYLESAVSRGVIAAGVADVLLVDLDGPALREPQVTEPPEVDRPAQQHRVEHHPVNRPATAAAPVRPWRPPITPPPRPAPRPVVVEHHEQPATVGASSSVGGSWSRAASAWWSRARAAVVTDLAVHGLAYLGVLLLFAGVFGLVYYSGEMRPAWRLVADVAAPAALFGAGWFLRTRGAKTVGAALTVLGAVVLPLVVIAALTDGSPVPPDLDGVALPLVQGALCLLIAIGDALVAHRRPDSPLRFLVAPVAWLAIAVALGAMRDPIPTGQEVAQATSLQLAVLLAVVAATMLAIHVTHRSGALAKATLLVATPVAAVVYVAELLVARASPSSVTTILVVALAASVVVQLTPWLAGAARAAAEVVVVALALSQAAHTSALSWVAVVAVAGLLTVDATSARASEQAAAHWLRLSAVAASLMIAAGDPYAGVVAFVIAASWLLWDRARQRGGLPFVDRLGLAPGAALLGAVVEASIALDTASVAVGAAIATMVLAITRRWSSFLRRDQLWMWWPTVAGMWAVAATGREAGGEWSGSLALTLGVVAATVALSGLPIAARVWGSGALATAGVVGWCSMIGLGNPSQGVVISVVGLAAVAVGVLLPGRAPSHLGWLGHALGCAVAPLLAPPWSPAFAVSASLAAAGWFVVAVAHERGSARHVEALQRWAERSSGSASRMLDSVPAVLGFVAIVVAAIAIADSSGWVAASSPWAAVVATGAATVLALLVRSVRWHRAHPLALAWLAVATCVGAAGMAVGSAPDDGWPVTLALLGGMIVSASPRMVPLPMRWIGWALSIGVSLTAAHALGLDRSGIALAVAGWGGAMLMAGCAVERARHGPAAWRSGFVTATDQPLGWLGSIALVVGSVVAVADQTPQFIGWTSFGAACILLVVALLRPLAPLLGGSLAGFTVAACLIPPLQLFERPVWLVGLVAVLLIGAAFLRTPADRDLSMRWDLPLFWAAHGVAIAAIASAGRYGSAMLTFAGLAVLAFAIAFVLRNPVWCVVGGLLALASAASASLGWLALVLALEGAVLTVLATRRTRWSLPLAVLGVLQELTAWVVFVAWREWSPESVALVTAPAASALALVAVIVAVRRRDLRPVAGVWAIAGPSVTILAIFELLESADVGRAEGGWTAALSFTLLAVTAAISTAIAGRAMSWLSVAASWSALAAAVYALGPGPVVVVVLCSAGALVICTVMLVVQFVRPTDWAWQMAALSAAVQLGAFGVLADVESSKTELVVLVLVALAVETAAAALSLDVEWLFLASPVLSCAAWLVYAVDVAGAEPLWLVVPAGMTVLVEASIVRWVLHGRGRSATGAAVAALELLGMMLVVGGFLGRMLVGSLWYSFGAIAAGTLLAMWGATTKVRRRVLFGVAADLAAIVLLVAIPLSSVHPDWSGVTLWLVVAGIGALAIAVAAFVERGKSVVRRWVDAVEDATADWERTGGPDPQQRSEHASDRPSSVTERHILAEARQHLRD